EGDTVSVGQVIARMALGAGAPAAAAEAAPTAETPAPTTAAVPAGANVSPVAARVAAAEGVDLATIKGTGPRGRITKADVLGGNGATAAPAAEAQPLRGGAAMLARYMDESRTIPTATSFRTMT